MGSELVQHKLGDLVHVTDYVANGSFATLKENVRYLSSPGFAILIRTVDFNGGWNGDYVWVGEQAYTFLSKSKLSPGDLVMSNVGSVGIVFRVPNLGTPMTLGPNAVMCRSINQSLLDQAFLYYYFLSQAGQELLRSISSGSVQLKFNKTDLRNSTLLLPDIRIQRAASRILNLIDDRIDLLRQTNAALESIAQALFKSWFIDFDPVRAKADGREPEGMDAATAALFPAEFEESALGLIPKNWRVGSVYEVANVIYGAPFSSKQFNTDANGHPLVRIRDLRDEAPGVWTPEVHPKGYLLRPGDIVVGMDGEFRAYLWGGVPAWMNQRVCCFQPVAPHCAAFVRCAIAGPLAHIEATEVATTVIHLGKGDIDRFMVVVPPADVASAFANVADPLYTRIVTNKAHARQLSELRDALLPRLISGKLRLPEAQEQVEDALA